MLLPLLAGLIITFAIHAAVLVGLVYVVNDGDELDYQSAFLGVIICTAIGMGWGIALDQLNVPAGVQWLAYIPLAGLMGLVVALVSGIPVVRAMIVGALYTVFLISCILCLAIVSVLVIRTIIRQKRYAQSRRELRERLARQQQMGNRGDGR